MGFSLGLRTRLVFLAQYAPERILNLKGEQHGLAVPFLRQGENVWPGRE
jgi:hypothetical protein